MSAVITIKCFISLFQNKLECFCTVQSNICNEEKQPQSDSLPLFTISIFAQQMLLLGFNLSQSLEEIYTLSKLGHFIAIHH
jgi:hypothetical protein